MMNYENFDTSVARPIAHLSETDLDELFMGLGSAEAMDHVAGCAHCRAQVESFMSAVTAFNEATLEWSEAKSNTISRDLAPGRPRFSIPAAVGWSLTATLLVAVTAGVFELHSARQSSLVANDAPGVVKTSAAANQPDTQIADDDAMLRAIDSEVNRAEPSPLAEYQATSARDARPAQQASGRVME